MNAHMKKTAYLLLSILAFTTVVGCDDLLDVIPQDRVTPDTFFKTEKELKAFQRVTVRGGETKKVTLVIPFDDLRYWNEETNAWDLEHGKLQLLLGSSSDDIRLISEVTI